jgi:UDP-galactopyranose mutase
LIGFHGTLGSWLDYELLAGLAQARPEWSWVFVGPAAAAGTARLAHLPNVHLLGAVPFDQLPAYTTRFTAGIIPFVDNELTRGVHPIKALEYLAAGIPIVASRLPDLAPLGDLIRFAGTTSEWLAQLDKAVQASSDQATLAARRRAVAAEHTWDSRAEEIVALIQQRLCQPKEYDTMNDGRAAA